MLFYFPHSKNFLLFILPSPKTNREKPKQRTKERDRKGIAVGSPGRAWKPTLVPPCPLCCVLRMLSWVMQAMTVNCKYHMWVYLDLCILCLIHESGRSSAVCWVFPLLVHHFPCASCKCSSASARRVLTKSESNLEQFVVELSLPLPPRTGIGSSTRPCHDKHSTPAPLEMWSQMRVPRETMSLTSSLRSLAEPTEGWWCVQPTDDFG